ncbi:MAG: hypothetical protein RIF32_20280 [Leptospirales bacterium]|jgi:hypothetical protein
MGYGHPGRMQALIAFFYIPAKIIMESAEKNFLEYAANVFHEISLLEIRKSYRLLSELEPELIENFVQKYSDFAIFLLNILDQKRSTELLEKLTDSALVYIVEEELRTLLIREVGNIARVGGDFAEFSLFMELCDRPAESGEIPEFVAKVLRTGVALREMAGRSYFAALDAIEEERRERVLQLIYGRNIYVGVGSLMYASDQVLSSGLDYLALRRPALLALVPQEWYLIRFRHGHHGPYLRENVFPHLPADIQARLRSLTAFLQRHNDVVLKIQQAREAEPNPAKARQALVDLIYGLIQKAEPDQVDLLLQNFEQDGFINSADRELIRTVAGRS